MIEILTMVFLSRVAIVSLICFFQSQILSILISILLVFILISLIVDIHIQYE